MYYKDSLYIKIRGWKWYVLTKKLKIKVELIKIMPRYLCFQLFDKNLFLFKLKAQSDGYANSMGKYLKNLMKSYIRNPNN